MTRPAPTAGVPVRLLQLVVSSAVVGVGVSLLLKADLGADGFAMLLDGVSRAANVSFLVANILVSSVFIVFAAWRGTKPGLGTIVLPLTSGAIVTLLDGVTPAPDLLGWRIVEFSISFVVICFGVAGYLAANLGAGPADAAALSLDPPIPFRWSLNLVLLVGAIIGTACGATFGVGTLVMTVAIGPCVAYLLPIMTIGNRTVTDPLVASHDA